MSITANASAVAWGLDDLLVVGRRDGSISAVDPTDLNRVLWTLRGHNAAAENLEVSADGRILVSSTPSETKVWDLIDLQLLVELPAPSRDGLRIHTSGADGTDPLLVPSGTWYLDDDTVLDAACHLAGRPMTEDQWDLYLPDGEPYDPSCAAG